MESCIHAVDLERYERRAPFPLALGRHAQNAIILIVLLGVDGLASKSIQRFCLKRVVLGCSSRATSAKS